MPIVRRLTAAGNTERITTGGDVVVYGLEGNDTISVSSLVNANDPGDTLFGGIGNDNLGGGNSPDVLYGGAGADVAQGNDGNDTLDGDSDDSNPNDTNYGPFLPAGTVGAIGAGDGADTLDGGEGDDVVFGRGGADILLGGRGDDTLWGGDGNDILTGGGGLVTAGSGDRLFGGAGNDTLTTSFGADSLQGDDGDDAMASGDGADTLNGGAGADNLNAGNGNDLLIGGAGADSLTGGEGFDTLDYATSPAAVNVQLGTTVVGAGGDAAGDALNGIEALIGSNFNDLLIGDGLANRLDGNGGNDIIVSGLGADTLIGGSGLDEVNYSGSAVGVTVNLATNAVSGGDAELDSISGFEFIAGSNFAGDTLTGDGASNRLLGNGGNDLLDGAGGNDTIDGGAGNDTAIGGAGVDQLIGGTGADVFRFLAATDSPNLTPDLISFSKADLDLIDFSVIDAKTGVDGDQAFTFLTAPAAAFTAGAAGGEVRFGGGPNLPLGPGGALVPTTIVQFDTDDPDNAPNSTIFVAGVVNFAASDFIL